MFETEDYTRIINEECGNCFNWVDEAPSDAVAYPDLLWTCPFCDDNRRINDYYG